MSSLYFQINDGKPVLMATGDGDVTITFSKDSPEGVLMEFEDEEGNVFTITKTVEAINDIHDSDSGN